MQNGEKRDGRPFGMVTAKYECTRIVSGQLKHNKLVLEHLKK
jgi:hypothetical protein